MSMEGPEVEKGGPILGDSTVHGSAEPLRSFISEIYIKSSV